MGGGPLPKGDLERVVDCPRCHQTCGWCGDYRHMHGQISLPGTKKYCGIEVIPEGDACPVCGGDKRVVATTTFTRGPRT